MSHIHGVTRLDALRAWRVRARKALDSWTPSPEMRIAVELEEAHRDGIKLAAKLIDEKGQRGLAMLVRRLAETSG